MKPPALKPTASPKLTLPTGRAGRSADRARFRASVSACTAVVIALALACACRSGNPPNNEKKAADNTARLGAEHAPTARRAPLVSGSQDSESLFDPSSGSYIKVRDVTDAMTRQAAPAPPQYAVDVFLRHREQRQAAPSALREDVPPPGGLGAGVTFDLSQLQYQDSTAVYYYLLAPPNIGGTPAADLLYMTSSDIAPKGCEALISFFKDEQFRAVFRIWDWATPAQAGGSHFIVHRPYDSLGDYLIPYEVQTGGQTLDFNAIYVVSATRRVSGDTWVNEVYLHNHRLGVRDRVWSYQFSWPTKPTDTGFWWGPIFETFPDNADYKTTNLLGFLETLVVQDGRQIQLTDQNSRLVTPSGHGLDLIYRSSGYNASLICN